MKFEMGFLLLLFSSATLAGYMPNFIKINNTYIYRTINKNGLKAFKVLQIDRDWMYVQHYRKRDNYKQTFWFSINNNNIKYITNCEDKNLHESEKELCDST